MTNKLYNSPNILVQTNNVDENGQSTDIPGFNWMIVGVYYDWVNSTANVLVRCIAPAQNSVVRTRREVFSCEEQWTDQHCVDAVLSRPVYANSTAEEILATKPAEPEMKVVNITEEGNEVDLSPETTSKPWYKTNPLKWFS